MMSLRERQKAGRRLAILDAASHLFRRNGFAATSMEQVAARAMLSVGTVYNYFRSKGDLLLALVALDGAEVRAAGARLVEQPPADAKRAVLTLLETYVDHSLVHLDKRLWRQMIGTALTAADTKLGAGYRALDRKLVAQVTALCRALQARGDLPPGLHCTDAGQVLVSLCNQAFEEFVADDGMTLPALKRRMARELRLVFCGISAGGVQSRPASQVAPRSGPRSRRLDS
jgi:AcrR family transcriptional regulator